MAAVDYKMNAGVSAYSLTSFNHNICFDAWRIFDLHLINIGVGYRSEKSLFAFVHVPLDNFIFSYTSENPLLSNHMMGNGHTFSVSW